MIRQASHVLTGQELIAPTAVPTWSIPFNRDGCVADMPYASAHLMLSLELAREYRRRVAG